jgi:hypothetical protein
MKTTHVEGKTALRQVHLIETGHIGDQKLGVPGEARFPRFFARRVDRLRDKIKTNRTGGKSHGGRNYWIDRVVAGKRYVPASRRDGPDLRAADHPSDLDGTPGWE